MYRGNYADALEYHHLQLKISEDIGFDEEKSTALSYLGHLYSRLEKFRDAVESYTKSAEIDLELGNIDTWAGKQINIGMAFNHIDESKEALKHHLKGLEITRQTGNLYMESWALGGISKSYRKMGKLDTALAYLNEKYALAKDLNDEQQQLDALIEFGKVFTDLARYGKAITNIENGIKLASEKGFQPHLIRCYETMSNAYRRQGDYEKAFEFYEKFHQLKETIH